MKAARVLTIVGALLLIVPQAWGQAEPGSGEYPGLETGKMWTFDVPPMEYWATRYNFRPSSQWLDHVRLASVRFGGNCSSSFVSANGLVMTNHHCARACIEAVTKQGEDLLGDGFYAPRREDERVCEGLFLDQLQAITDVTDSVTVGISATTPSGVAAERRAAAIKRLEAACGAATPNAACQVVTMYRGGQYKLYRFRRFTDVRLVFAVESQTGFFGGDPDNFTYPRFDLDMAMVRAYVDGKPANTEYFHWSPAGSKEGDLVFVTGNPGSTGRLNTMAQLEYLRDVQYPAQLDQLARQIAVYQDLSKLGEERALALRNTIFGLQNTQKAIIGYQSGLLNPALMAQKRTWEQNFRRRVAANAGFRTRFGGAWQGVTTTRAGLKAIDTRRRYHAFGAYGSRMLGLAGILVRWNTEMAKPDNERLAPYRDANKAAAERALASSTPVDPEQETRLLAAYLTAMKRELPATDPVLVAALGGRTPEEAARAMVAASTLKTAEGRKTLMDGGTAAIAASNDPFIRLARVIDPLERALQKRVVDLTNQEARFDEQIARALLAVFGDSVAPDATFSLRISDGEVKRYPLNGTYAPAYTTFYGLYDRHFSFAGKDPFHLAKRWADRRDSLNLSVPFNAVSTADIIGGNSGSPVIDREGQVVGLIFDGNIEMLPNRFLFTEMVARSVFVDSRGIIEALRQVYDATALADELEAKP
jgi:hypothetical protein